MIKKERKIKKTPTVVTTRIQLTLPMEHGSCRWQRHSHVCARQSHGNCASLRASGHETFHIPFASNSKIHWHMKNQRRSLQFSWTSVTFQIFPRKPLNRDRKRLDGDRSSYEERDDIKISSGKFLWPGLNRNRISAWTQDEIYRSEVARPSNLQHFSDRREDESSEFARSEITSYLAHLGWYYVIDAADIDSISLRMRCQISTTWLV